MFLTRFSLQNPVAVTLFFACVVLAGLYAFVRMGRSILPDVSFPVVTITAPYAGAGPNEIERLVIQPIEDQVQGLAGIDRVSAFAEDGLASVIVRFRFGTDVDAARQDVQRAVDAARANLPADLLAPAVDKTDPSQAPVLDEAVSSAVLSEDELSALVQRTFAPALRSAPAIGTVRIAGDRVPQFIITPRLGALEALHGTPLDVFRAVAAGNDTFPGGRFTSPVRESVVGIRAAVTSVRELEDLPVAIPGGGPVRLRDVAAVRAGDADRTVLTRVDDRAAIVVYVSRAQTANANEAIAAARTTFGELGRRYPLVRLQTLRTDDATTNAAVNGVLQTLSEGVVLTVLVMLLFLHAWRNALIAAVAIPSSLCAAFLAMWIAGFTVNVLSLMGLSLTIGILVDDSIVIIEAISRALDRGLRGDAAGLAGRAELGGAAFAITLADVAVFAPIGFMSGIVGEFMREFALVLVFATAFSLLVSFTLTPLLAACWAAAHAGGSFDRWSFAAIAAHLTASARRMPWTLRSQPVLRAIATYHAAINGFNVRHAHVARAYARRWLPAALRHRRAVLAVVALVVAGSLVPVLTGAIPTEFTPPVSDGQARLSIIFPAGTPLARTDARVRRIAERLLDDDAVRHVVVTSGRAFNGVADVFASNAAEMSIVLPASLSPDAAVRRVKDLQALAPEATILGSGRGMGGAAPITYDVGGSDDAVDAAALAVARALRDDPNADDVQTSNAGVRPRLDVTIDRGRALMLGVSPDDAAQTARILSAGAVATRLREPTGLVDVVVRGDALERGDADLFQRFPVRTSASASVPLGAIDSIARSAEPVVVERENGARIVTVSANARGAAPIGLVTRRMSGVLRDPGVLPPGTHVVPRGDIEQFLDAVRKLAAAMLLSVGGIYAILAILYRSYRLPLVIMTTVPLACAGAFGALYALNVLHRMFPAAPLFANQTLNLYSMLGMVMLTGLVAKNGVLLIDFAERTVRDGAQPAAAVLSAAERRFRPIVMTTLAMIAGCLPLALGHTAGAEERKALGTVVIGGLASSLFLTLFVVPIVYAWRPKTSAARAASEVAGAHLLRETGGLAFPDDARVLE
jgi:hydrophobic/amphiphilic exporter-1 (mainly G- bacteria), HAE1 family